MFGNKVKVIGLETTTQIGFSEEEIGYLGDLISNREYLVTAHIRELEDTAATAHPTAADGTNSRRQDNEELTALRKEEKQLNKLWDKTQE